MTETITAADAAKKAEGSAVFSSGSQAIDGLLGGGYRVGRTVEVFGPSNTGKTQLAMQSAMMVAKLGLKSLYLDSEGAFRPERIEEMAGERGWDAGPLLDRIVYLRVDSTGEQMEAVRRLHERRETSSCRFVVIDTLTRSFTLEYPGSSNTPSRQGALEVHLSEIARDAFLHGRAYLLANRVTFSESSDVHIGGQTLSQMVDDSVHLAREGDEVRATLVDKKGKSATGHILAIGFV